MNQFDLGYDSYSLSSNDSLPLQQNLKHNLQVIEIKYVSYTVNNMCVFSACSNTRRTSNFSYIIEKRFQKFWCVII